MKPRILLTGGSGFLGRILARDLSEDYEVMTLCRSNNCQIKCDLSKGSPIFHQSFRFVIHAAGLAHKYPHSAENEEPFMLTNYQGCKNLLLALNRFNEKPLGLILISTVSVYGLEQGSDIDETNPLNGTSAYAKSKILAEKFVIKWGKENQVIIGILRLPLVCGPNPPGNLGKMIKSFKSGLYPKIGEGNNRKSMVYGPDISRIIPVLLKKGGIYHLTDGYHPSLNELEEALSSVLGRKPLVKIPSIFASALAKIGDMFKPSFPINSIKLLKISSTLTFNDNKARKDLGYQSTRVLDVMDKIAS